MEFDIISHQTLRHCEPRSGVAIFRGYTKLSHQMRFSFPLVLSIVTAQKSRNEVEGQRQIHLFPPIDSSLPSIEIFSMYKDNGEVSIGLTLRLQRYAPTLRANGSWKASIYDAVGIHYQEIATPLRGSQ